MMTWALRPHGVRTRGKKNLPGYFVVCLVLVGCFVCCLVLVLLVVLCFRNLARNSLLTSAR